MKDDQMMARIKEAEHTQSVAILKQKISRLELKVSMKFVDDVLSCGICALSQARHGPATGQLGGVPVRPLF